MAAIELRINRYRQPQLAHRSLDYRAVRYRGDEIATHADEHFRPSVNNRLHRIDNGMAVLARWIEAEHSLDAVEQCRARLFVDTHGAVALHVGVTAHRTNSRAWLAEITTQQQQVGNLLHVRSARPVLSDPHTVDSDYRLGPHIDRGDPLDLRARQP